MSLFDEEYLRLAHDSFGAAGTDRQARYAAWAERRRLLADAADARRTERRGRRRGRPVAARPVTAAARLA